MRIRWKQAPYVFILAVTSILLFYFFVGSIQLVEAIHKYSLAKLIVIGAWATFLYLLITSEEVE